MKKYTVYLDEKVSIWQRVQVTIEAETEEQLKEILSSEDQFNEFTKDQWIDCQIRDCFPETEEHLEFDFNNVDFLEMKNENN